MKHDEETYEISQFLRNHPGGVNTLEHFKGRDISMKLRDIKHSSAAKYLMKEYKIEPKERSEDLERLIDWNQPMLAQVGSLGPHYYEWVTSPVDRNLRLFGSDYLEVLSKTPWYMIPVVWIPVIIAFAVFGIREIYNHYQRENVFIITTVFVFCFGVALWSILEYSLHRWVFHLKPPDWSPKLITMHFLLHGLHHKVPFDSGRLLFPPVPAAMLGVILYTLISSILPQWMLHCTCAGVATGYLCYDLTHFYLHYGSPSGDSYLYTMKRYHNQHHFAQQEIGFGISTSFWDRIFKTEISLPKLNMTLKWW